MAPVASSRPLSYGDGIGVVDFLEGKNFFITGATGFLAKAIVEKVLREVPDVGKMYLLIKGKNKEDAVKRLKRDIIETELFKCLKEKNGETYEAFMLSKLEAVVGDVGQPNLGMEDETTSSIVNHVDVIVNSAATTNFDERYDVALNVNTKGVLRLMDLAKKCKKLCFFMHVSTAFVNGKREGVILEQPFYMGQNITREQLMSSSDSTTPTDNVPYLDVDAELELVSKLIESLPDNELPERMQELGLERARFYGWNNTYELTKAMGEMLVNRERENIPVVISRPSIIESTYSDPFPGWIQGYRMMDPMLVFYGKGELPAFVGNPETILDVIPLDMVVNAIIASMAKHGNEAKPGLNVYQVTSSNVNPFRIMDLMNYMSQHYNTSPLVNSKGQQICVPKFKLFTSMESLCSYINNNCNPMKVEIKNRKLELILHMANLYKPYVFHKGRFDNGNSKSLMGNMSMEEKMKFGFDVEKVNWDYYIQTVHIPGLKRHVINK